MVVDKIIFGLIVFFALLSYAVGIKQMLGGTYKPSVFTRVIWIFLAINSLFGVVLSHSTTSSIVLASAMLAGNVAFCGVSLFKGDKRFGLVEYVSIALLIISGLVWVLFDSPLINLSISLVAHFIGGIPTYVRVLRKPTDESPWFWILFFIASLLSIIISWGSPISLLIFPIYYTIFDGSMFGLSLRGRKGGA